MAIGNRDTYSFANYIEVPSIVGTGEPIVVNGAQITTGVVYLSTNINGAQSTVSSPISNKADKNELVRFGHRNPGSRLHGFLPPQIQPYNRTSALFDPREFGNVALWMDASDKSSVILDGSSRVSEWRDKSGNSRHHTQSTLSQRPYYTEKVNDLNAISFTSADSTSLLRTDEDWIYQIMNYPVTIVLVASATANGGVFYQTTDASAFQNAFLWMFNTRDGNSADNEVVWEFNTTAGFHASYTSPAYVFNSNRIFSARTDGLSSRNIRDGNVQSDFTTTVANLTSAIDTSVFGAYFTSGTSHSWLDGRIMELIIFPEYIGDSRLLYMNNKLADKWGISL